MSLVKSIELSSEVRLPYVEQGDISGTPVIFLHAIADSWHSFERVLPHLPDSIHAFVVTQRGHGDASRPADGYRPDDFATARRSRVRGLSCIPAPDTPSIGKRPTAWRPIWWPSSRI